jgi:hypothetical protein
MTTLKIISRTKTYKASEVTLTMSFHFHVVSSQSGPRSSPRRDTRVESVAVQRSDTSGRASNNMHTYPTSRDNDRRSKVVLNLYVHD